MKQFLETIAIPIWYFENRPGRIACVALFFLLTHLVLLRVNSQSNRVRAWPALFLSLLWAAWVLWESQMSPGSGAIRVDLMGIGLVLYIATPVSLLGCFRFKTRGA